MQSVTLYRIDSARNMRRFYRLEIQVDLFGVWLLKKEWGRIGRHGQSRSASFDGLADARHAMFEQQRAKEKRGYKAT